MLELYGFLAGVILALVRGYVYLFRHYVIVPKR